MYNFKIIFLGNAYHFVNIKAAGAEAAIERGKDYIYYIAQTKAAMIGGVVTEFDVKQAEKKIAIAA